ncbi:hypothetical protein Q7C36_018788 [Tachysurus vachellii]|uniref:Uncharacterized protein n=1 Tax=Tachysurus vachellii TaxID=175792 RepID=A0AA88LV59_TACVA|nr:hypothetical protein Q7C36_018788 [Tachysurus vachellii]
MNKVKYGADASTLRCAACFACRTSANALCSPSHTAPSGRKSGFPSHCISDLHGRIQKPHAHVCDRLDLSVLDDSRVSRERTLGLMSGSSHVLAISERIIFLISQWAESDDGVQLLSGIHAVVISGRLLVQIPDQTESQH